MSKNLRPKRVSSLGGLRSPEEVKESVEQLTSPSVSTPEPSKNVSVEPVAVKKTKVVQTKPATATKAKTPVRKAKKAPTKEIVKFVKLEDEHHMVAKIAATKKRTSIKAYLEELVRRDNPDMFK